jgi:hypothetical protein
MRCLKIVLSASLSFLFFVPGFSAAAKTNRPCTRADAQKAEAEAERLETRSAVYLSFTRYAGCDDGAIAEGYSDLV